MFLKSFQFKLFSSFILFGLILSGVTLYIFTKVIEEGYLSQKTDLFYDMIIEKDTEVLNFENMIRSKLDLVSTNRYFKNKDKSKNKDIQIFLETILISDDSFNQISYLDNNGNDILKVVKSKPHRTIKSFPYYKDVLNLKTDEIYTSKFFYNKEIETLCYKMIKKIEKGFLVIDINLENSIFKTIKSTYKENWYIVDSVGNFLIHKDIQYNWAGLYDIKHSLKDQFPKNYKKILEEDVYFDDQIMSKKITLLNGDDLFLILSYTENFADDVKSEYLSLFKLIVGVSVLVSIILALILSKPFISINKKLNKLNDNLDKQVRDRTEELSSSLKLIDKYIINSKTDLAGKITYVSEAFCDISGYTKEELIGKSHNIIRNPENPKSVFEKLWKTIKDGQSWSGEIANVNKDGEKYYVYSNIEPQYRNGKMIGYMAVGKNITDKKNLERLNKELENRVEEEVEKNIEQHQKHVEDRIKNAQLSSIGELAAGITHEINTPLTYIKGNIEMMKYDIEDMSDEKLRDSFLKDFVKVEDGILRIESIIDTMREVSQTNQESRYESNVFETLIVALTMVNNRAKQISKISINSDLFDLGYPKDKLTFISNIQKQRVEQLWIILLNNALDVLEKTHEYEDRIIEVDVKCVNEKIIVRIKDNGGGINNEMIDHIFDPFIGKKKHGGLGIGLNVAKKIVDDQNGEILAYNQNDGAVFEVILDEYR